MLGPMTYGIMGALQGGGAAPVEYLLRDEFVTTEGAPMASPRTAEPGPGTLTLVQNDGELSISGEKLNFPPQTTATFGDQGFYAATGIARAAGRALVGTFNFSARSNGFLLNWTASAKAPSAFSDVAEGVFLSGSIIFIPTNNTGGAANPNLGDIGFFADGTDLRMAVILRSQGAWYTVKGGAYTEETLVHVSGLNTAATLYPSFSNYASAGTLDNFHVRDLGSPWDSDFGFANYIETPATGQSLAGYANGIVEFSWIPQAGETLDIYFRMSDASNAWICRCVQASNTIGLVSLEAGVETADATQAQTWTVGTRYRIIIWPYGSAIRVTVSSGTVAEIRRILKTGATFNQAATGSKVTGFAEGLDYATWPETVDTEAGV